jgi:DNA-binding Xre family transcriptional regulator
MAAVFKSHLKALILNKAAAEGEPINQTQIHEATGLSLPAIARWYGGELDRIEADPLMRLMNYLGCDIGDLISVQEVGEDHARPVKGTRGRPKKVKGDQ